MDINSFIENFADQFDDLDASTLSGATVFKDLDEWSSMMALAVMAMVNEEYDVELKGDDIRKSNTIEDLFNGEILAWKISTSPDSALCIETIESMCNTWGDCFQGSIIHSNLGTSYMSYEYMETVKSHGMIMSVGKKGSCYDNAAMDSLN